MSERPIFLVLVDPLCAKVFYSLSLSLRAVRVLRGAFLKVEDLSRAYKPLVLEMKKWPRPLCHASHKASPFDPPQLSRSPQQQKKKEGGGGGCDKVEKRPGHCECCCVRFEDLHMVSVTTYMFCIDPQLRWNFILEVFIDFQHESFECVFVSNVDVLSLTQHLRSARHQEYARNEENFSSLDKLIAQSKSFDQFISELKTSAPTSW